MSASPGCDAFFARWPELGTAEQGGIPAVVCELLSTQMRRAAEDGESSASVLLTDDLVVHLATLEGVAGARISALFEPFQRRDPVGVAARTFKLTPREADVLRYLLRGCSAAEIAAELSLSELTISDYFKSLHKKTKSATLSGTIATLLHGA